MTYAFCLSYLVPVVVLDAMDFSTVKLPRLSPIFAKHAKTLLLVCCLLLAAQNIIYSNQVYTKKKLAYGSTLSTMTRVVYSMESTDGYIAGETPVYLVGTLESNPYCNNLEEFRFLNVMSGVYPDVTVTYSRLYENYFHFIMNCDVNLIYEGDNSYEDLPEVDAMPTFPQNGFCAMIDGALVVKLS